MILTNKESVSCGMFSCNDFSEWNRFCFADEIKVPVLVIYRNLIKVNKKHLQSKICWQSITYKNTRQSSRIWSNVAAKFNQKISECQVLLQVSTFYLCAGLSSFTHKTLFESACFLASPLPFYRPTEMAVYMHNSPPTHLTDSYAKTIQFSIV